MRTLEYSYAQQSSTPKWYGSYELNLSATSGSSRFNEWYGFHSREDAVEVLSQCESQSFLDCYTVLGWEIWDNDDLDFDGEGNLLVVPGATPADLDEVVQTQSRF